MIKIPLLVTHCVESNGVGEMRRETFDCLPEAMEK